MTIQKEIHFNSTRFFTFFFEYSLFALGVSIFVSKSGLIFFFPITVLLPILFYKSANLKIDNVKFVFLMLFALLCFSAMISMSVLQALNESLANWPYLLTIIPLSVVLKSPNFKFKFKFYQGLITGLCIATINSFIKAYLRYNIGFLSLDEFRIASFWDIGRWGTVIGIATISTGLFSINYKFFKNDVLFWEKKWFNLILFFLSLASLILSNTRGPLLFTIISISTALLLQLDIRKIFLSFILILGLSTVGIYSSPKITSRLQSIFDIKKDKNNQNITSSNPSNLGRLNMWKVAIDFWKENKFTPTGFGQYEKPLNDFLKTKDPQYIDDYTRIEFSHHDTHNSYLYMLIQIGIIFTIAFWLVVFYYLTVNIKYIWKLPKGSLDQTLILTSYAIILYHLCLGLVYSSLVSYESITFFIPLGIIIYLPRLKNRQQISTHS